MPPDRLADDERRQRGEASWREVMVKAPPKPISPYIAQGILEGAGRARLRGDGGRHPGGQRGRPSRRHHC